MLRSIAGVCGITSQVIGLIAWLVVVLSSPWFSWTENAFSVLGAEGSAKTVFNSGVIITGALSIIFAIGLGKTLLSGRLLGQLGMVSLILGSCAISGIGIFPQTTGLPHYCSSVAALIFIPVALFLIGVSAINASQKVGGVLSLTAGILTVVFQLVPWLWSDSAILQLLSYLPWSLWTIAFAIRLLIRPKPVEVSGISA